MTLLNDKHIVLGISGGIAAYKCGELVRELRQAGAEVKVIMTKAAQMFITPITLQALSGHPVYADEWLTSPQQAMDHITLARWADLVLLAPATADSIARLAHGHANDLLTTTCLATTAPIVIAPAMNQQMWLNPLVQNNITCLRQYGIKIIAPGIGEQACGEIGPGRLPEPQELLSAIMATFITPCFLQQTFVITAGPTHEPLDPVRYLSSRSSGKMGYALAAAAVDRGANVILISGPTTLTPPQKVKHIAVTTAQDMLAAVMQNITYCDVFIGAAAVVDFCAVEISTHKIKKQAAPLNLNLVPNPDILAAVAKLSPRPFVVGFAAETENLHENAQRKLKQKQLDLIVANLVGTEKGFAVEDNAAIIFDNMGLTIDLPLMSKLELATQIITIINQKQKQAR